MEHKSDYIEREVQKIIFLLKNVIAKIAQGVDTKTVLESLDEVLKGKLDFELNEILELNNDDLKEKFKGIDVLILENLLKVFYEVAKKELSPLKIKNLKRISLAIIYKIEYKSLVYSLERTRIKNYFKSK